MLKFLSRVLNRTSANALGVQGVACMVNNAERALTRADFVLID